jgi:hypothetical protein
MKQFVKFAIVTFWLLMVGLLVRRNLPEQASPPLPGASLEPLRSEQAQEEWMGIYHQGQKIGYLQRRLTPTAAGYQWEEIWRMRMRFLNTPQTIHTAIRADTDATFALTRFDFRLLSSGLTFRASGAVQAQTLYGQMSTGGEASFFSFPLHSPIYLPAATQLALRNALLREGDERRFSVFNPLSMRTETMTVAVVGPETLTLKGQLQKTTKVMERFGETTAHAWLDADGKVVKEEASLGMVLLRESEQEALGGGWQDSTPFDLVSSVAIPVQQTLPNPRALALLRLRLVSPLENLQFSFPPRQQQQEHLLTITQEGEETFTTYTLPQTDPEFAADLTPTPFLQSAHPRLVAQAQQILGAEHDALHAARQLLDWTYATVEKKPSLGLPTALDVLDSKRGDCNEHAVLFTALARASGIPSRVVAGVVYLDGSFYYHAWSEIWLGQWVAVDPTFHQFPADATHVKFVDGWPEQHLALLKVIGRIGMEIVDYKNSNMLSHETRE